MYFLNVYKPKGITSFDVIFKLRKILGIKKIGHAGTLDPMAEGVMQVGVGDATKLLDYLFSDKEYIAEIKFGFISSTLDAEGEITKADEPDFNEEELKAVIKNFIGEIEQIPPKFSAIKVNGVKLCDLARKKPECEIEIPKRTIKIYDIELMEFKNYIAKIKVNCSKGTYIRTLADDIAKKLGTRSYLTSLIRTKAGNFKIEDSIQIENITKDIKGIEPICAINLPKYVINDKEYNLVKNGVKISAKGKNQTVCLIYKERLVSIADLIDNTIKVKKNFKL